MGGRPPGCLAYPPRCFPRRELVLLLFAGLLIVVVLLVWETRIDRFETPHMRIVPVSVPLPTPRRRYWYNPSLFRDHGGALRMFVRRSKASGRESVVALAEVDERTLVPTAARFVNIQPAVGLEAEDARGIPHAGALYAAYTGWRRPRTHAAMEIARVVAEGPCRGILLRYRRNGEPGVVDKNWGLWSEGGRLFFLYTPCPLEVGEVLDPESGLCAPVSAVSWEPRGWRWGTLRGSAPPVRRGDEMYAFVHSVLPSLWSTKGFRYFTGLVTFRADGRGGWVPSRYARRPLWRGPEIGFCAGAARSADDAGWVLSCGIDDERSVFVEMPDADVEERLVAVEEGGAGRCP